MNARYVGFTPYAAWNSCLSFARIATTFDMSTSMALVTWAAVSNDRRMCSAMPRRIAVTGSTASPASGSTAGASGAAVTVGGAVGDGGAAGGVGAGAGSVAGAA